MKHCHCGQKVVGFVPDDTPIIYIYCEKHGIIKELPHTLKNKRECLTRIGNPPVPINESPRQSLIDNFKGKRGRRSSKQIGYSYKTISSLTGKSVNYLRLLAHKQAFILESLQSVIEYIVIENLAYFKRFIQQVEDGQDVKLDLIQEQDRKARLQAAIKATKHIKI